MWTKSVLHFFLIFWRRCSLTLYLCLGVLVYPAEEVADPAVNPREVQLAAASFVVRAPATRHHTQQYRPTSLYRMVHSGSEVQILLTPALLYHEDKA